MGIVEVIEKKGTQKARLHVRTSRKSIRDAKGALERLVGRVRGMEMRVGTAELVILVP